MHKIHINQIKDLDIKFATIGYIDKNAGRVLHDMYANGIFNDKMPLNMQMETKI